MWTRFQVLRFLDFVRYSSWISQLSSVAQSCPTLCDPMNRSMPGLPAITNSWSPPKPMSTVSVMPSNHLILCRFPSPPAPNLSQHQLCHTAGVLCRTTTGTRLLGLRTFSAICDSDPGQFNLAYPPYHHILNGNHNTLLRGMRVK